MERRSFSGKTRRGGRRGMPGPAGGDSGFTILEVALALLILSLMAVPFLNMFYTGTKAYQSSAEETVALKLAEGVMEEQIDKGYDEADSQPAAPYPNPDFTDYQVEVAVSEYDDGDPNTKIKEVVVLVTGPGGKPSVTLRTLLAGL